MVFSVICTNIVYNLYNTCYQRFDGFEDAGLIYWVPIKNFTEYLLLDKIDDSDFDQVTYYVSIIVKSNINYKYIIYITN